MTSSASTPVASATRATSLRLRFTGIGDAAVSSATSWSSLTSNSVEHRAAMPPERGNLVDMDNIVAEPGNFVNDGQRS